MSFKRGTNWSRSGLIIVRGSWAKAWSYVSLQARELFPSAQLFSRCWICHPTSVKEMMTAMGDHAPGRKAMDEALHCANQRREGHQA